MLKLKAQHRWCLTGSPIFNRVHDLNALLKFLRAYPFDSASYFNSHITDLLKTDEKKAIANLKKLFNCVALRRTKSAVTDQLQLMARFEKVQEVEFSSHERSLYEVLRRSLSYLFHSSEEDTSKIQSSGSILQTITRLRRFCNHNLDLLPPEIGMLLEGFADEKRIAEALMNSPKTCDCCNVQLSIHKSSELIFTSFQCGHTLCSRCSAEQQALNQNCLLCFGLEVSQLPSSEAKSGKSEQSYRNYQPSSKVLALLKNLSAEHTADPNGKRYPNLHL